MFDGAARRLSEVARDPELRRWLAGRFLGRWPGEPAFTPHRPPYLTPALPLAQEAPDPPAPFTALDAAPPNSPLVLFLPGADVHVDPGDEAALFDRPFADTETLLALHRFAWVPLQDPDPTWVNALWRAWAGRFAVPGEGWPWHPYTAAERAVNMLRFARAHGLPGRPRETLELLAAHGPAIARRLEYFGDHHTSNHLANNGRGLFLLGLELGLRCATDMGGCILLEEGARIFHPSGVLREASSHYHCLATRNYVECWLAARAHARPEAAALEALAGRALSVIPELTLAAGMPLVGDISPDCPPDFLDGRWTGLLAEEDARAVADLLRQQGRVDTGALAAAGWRRAGFGPWDGLWHAAPSGWSPMPGHGHQDCAAFELHYGAERVFVDPGRGAYGETGEAARYRSGAVHNTLLIDGHDPYPPNRPYYTDVFRHRFGPPPETTRTDAGIEMTHHGYRRLTGVGAVTRRWAFSERGFTLNDRVEGTGSGRTIMRILVTPHDVSEAGGGLTIQGESAAWWIRYDGECTLQPMTCWRAYGRGAPATAIEIAASASLPWEGALTVEAA